MKRSKKILIYKIACLLFAAVLLLLPQRVMPHSDIRVIATVLGIDGKAGDVTVSAQLAVPVAQGTGGQASTVAEAKGGCVSEAIENLEIGLGRQVSYGHLSAVAIGKDMKPEDIERFLTYLMSSGKAGPGVYLVYCSATSASEFISAAQGLGESSDAELGNYISYSKSGNHVSTMSILNFLSGLNSASHASFMPCVELDKQSEDGQQSGGNGEQSSGSGQQEESGKSGGEQSGNSKKLVASDSVAIMGGDVPDVVVLNSTATKGIVWQDNHSDYGLVELRDVVLDGQEYPSISAHLTSKKVRKSVKRINGENVFTYKIKIKLRLDGAGIYENPLTYDKIKKTLESEFESLVENGVKLTAQAAKNNEIDFLGMRDRFHKFCRKGYENFDLQNVVVKVEASVAILS